MQGIEIPFVQDLRYLGLNFDPKLSWAKHVTERVKKCNKRWNLTRCLVGQKWGLSPEKTLWIYKAIIRPIMSYGSLVWAHRLNKTLETALNRLQRRLYCP